MSEEFTLTDAQVENWRKILITMPLPPLNLTLGAYALIMPREQVVEVASILNEKMKTLSAKIEAEEKPANWDSNIIRTRPRNPNKPVRG